MIIVFVLSLSLRVYLLLFKSFGYKLSRSLEHPFLNSVLTSVGLQVTRIANMSSNSYLDQILGRFATDPVSSFTIAFIVAVSKKSNIVLANRSLNIISRLSSTKLEHRYTMSSSTPSATFRDLHYVQQVVCLWPTNSSKERHTFGITSCT